MARRPDPGASERIERMFRTHSPRLYRYARLRLDHEDAQEAVGDAFTIAWTRLPETPEHELAWLLGVTRRVVSDRLKRLNRQRRLTDLVTAQPAVLAAPDHAAGVTAAAEIVWVLGELSEKDREVLSLLLVYDMAPAELGLALGCRPNTAVVRASRARQRFAQVLAESRASPSPDPADTSPTDSLTPDPFALQMTRSSR